MDVQNKVQMEFPGKVKTQSFLTKSEHITIFFRRCKYREALTFYWDDVFQLNQRSYRKAQLSIIVSRVTFGSDCKLTAQERKKSHCYFYIETCGSI